MAAWVSFRNTPLLVQLLFWYFAAWNLLPLAVKEVVNDEHAWSILPGNVWWLTPEFSAQCGGWGLYLRLSGGRDRLRTARRQPRAAGSRAVAGLYAVAGAALYPPAAGGWPTPGSRLTGQYLNLMKLSSLASGIALELTYQVRQIESYNAHALEAFAVGTARTWRWGWRWAWRSRVSAENCNGGPT